MRAAVVRGGCLAHSSRAEIMQVFGGGVFWRGKGERSKFYLLLEEGVGRVHFRGGGKVFSCPRWRRIYAVHIDRIGPQKMNVIFCKG